MSSSSRYRVVLALPLAALVTASPVLAAEPASPASGQPAADTPPASQNAGQNGAPNNTGTGDIPTLGEVVVSASREATKLSETPAAVGRVSDKTLQTNQPTFIGQVLDTIPGVHMVDLGNEQHMMSIRQPLGTAPVYLYLEDGIPIRPLGVFNHNALNEINLDGEGSIEVIKGPASSLYGSNAVGGTVNFLTRAPSLTPETALAVRGSDQGYRRVDAEASNTWGDAGVRVSAYDARRIGGWQEHSDMKKHSYTVRGDYTVSDNALLRTVLTHNQLLSDMAGSLNAQDYQTRPGYSYNTFTYRHDTATRLSSTLEGEWNRNGLSTLTVYGRKNDHAQLPSYMIWNSKTDPSAASGRINDNRYTSLGLDAHHRQDFAWWNTRLIVGATVDRSPNRYEESNLAIVRDPITGRYLSYTVTSERRNYKTLIQNRAFYTQAELSPVVSVRVVLGGRYDRIDYDYTNNLAPSSTTGAPSEVRSFSHFSPKAGLSWTLNPATNAYANYSQGFLPPEVSSLYGRLAVPNLKPAVFDNYEVGMRHNYGHGRGWVNISLYRLDGHDEFVNYTIQPGLYEPRNAGRTRHEGIEFGWGYEPDARWELRLGATVARHRYLDYAVSATTDYAGNDMPQAPRFIGNGEVAYKPVSVPGLRAALEVMHLNHYWMNNANTVTYPGHTLLNLRLSYDRGPWQTWLHVLNLGDEHYAEYASSSYSGSGTYNPNSQDTYTPGAPRTVLLGVRYRFGNPDGR